MPVTARLFRAFYERLGDDIANELVDWLNQVDLTYRTELRELNELNFARFDARVGERLAELRSELRIELRAEFQAGLGEVRAEVKALDARLAGLQVEVQRIRISGIRWTVAFWVPMILTMVAMLLRQGG